MNPNIILLFGGDSDERLVSVASAQTIAQNLPCAKLWFWHKNGPIFELDYQQLINHTHPFTTELQPKNQPIFDTISQAIASPISNNHVFFLAVHGGSQENGDLQKILEYHQRPFTGSDAQSSCIAFNKIATKEYLSKKSRIKLAPQLIIDTTSVQNIEPSLIDFVKKHTEIVVKPISGGSSIGCFFIRSQNDVKQTVSAISALSPNPFFAEKFIAGREITVGVLEKNGEVVGLPATEILLQKNRQFDYQGKYLGQGSLEITPAEISQEEMTQAQQTAIAAHTKLGLCGYSRSDLILTNDGFYFLEVNTLPGLSKTSLLPQQLTAASIALKDFLSLQVKHAMLRAQAQKHKELTP
jgi:D-alanine-D-alanine ligase